MKKKLIVAVLKFGGNCILTAEDLRHAINIIKYWEQKVDKVIVIFSAFEKTTDHLAKALDYMRKGKKSEAIRELAHVAQFHCKFINELFSNDNQCRTISKSISICTVNKILDNISTASKAENTKKSEDWVVALGEQSAVHIVRSYMDEIGMKYNYLAANSIIATDENFGEANVDIEATRHVLTHNFLRAGQKVLVMEGFIGCTSQGYTTTLGREGSDYTTGIVAYCLSGKVQLGKNVIVFKDVPGVFDEDPKINPNAKHFRKLSYADALYIVEILGAKIVHRKTIVLLQKAGLPLVVQSFKEPFDSKKSTYIS